MNDLYVRIVIDPVVDACGVWVYPHPHSAPFVIISIYRVLWTRTCKQHHRLSTPVEHGLKDVWIPDVNVHWWNSSNPIRHAVTFRRMIQSTFALDVLRIYVQSASFVYHVCIWWNACLLEEGSTFTLRYFRWYRTMFSDYGQECIVSISPWESLKIHILSFTCGFLVILKRLAQWAWNPNGFFSLQRREAPPPCLVDSSLGRHSYVKLKVS